MSDGAGRRQSQRVEGRLVQELESTEREEPRGKGRRFGWDLRCFPAATYQAIFFIGPYAKPANYPHSVEAGESGRSPGTFTDSDEESALRQPRGAL